MRVPGPAADRRPLRGNRPAAASGRPRASANRWNGPPPASTAWSRRSSSSVSRPTTPSRSSTSRSCRRSIPSCARNWASGTRRRRSSSTWSARVDQLLRSELGIADGLADDQVFVLDPAAGTGSYLVEVARRIHQTLTEQGHGSLAAARVKRALRTRIFGFEILPAPYVVAHLQLGVFLRSLGATLDRPRAVRGLSHQRLDRLGAAQRAEDARCSSPSWKRRPNGRRPSSETSRSW